jgi:hypothetical protein
MTDLNPGGWPDAARLGYPLHPRVTGPHQITHANPDWPTEGPWVLLWCAEEELWTDLFGNREPPSAMAHHRYLGPCHTPAEVAALVEAAKHGQHLIDTAREWGRADDDAEGPFNYIQRVSFEQGVADALNPERSYGLAAAVEAARREEREVCVVELYGIVADWPVPEAGATFHEIMMRDEAIMAVIRARGDA